MLKMAKRALALMLAMLILLASLAALAEDWRDMLRGAFGLSDDYEVETWTEPEATPTPKPTKAPKKTKAPKVTASPTRDGPITDPQEIVNYLDQYGQLPDNFITKKQAKALGWDSSYNYVGDVAPGKSIGGDRFGNYEGQLPEKKGRTWYECDTGYKGKKRGATRLLFSSDGLYYYTDDHYNTFTQMYPEGSK